MTKKPPGPKNLRPQLERRIPGSVLVAQIPMNGPQFNASGPRMQVDRARVARYFRSRVVPPVRVAHRLQVRPCRFPLARYPRQLSGCGTTAIRAATALPLR